MENWQPNDCPLDGEQNRIMWQVAPDGCTQDIALRGLAILFGAAGALAARLEDPLSFNVTPTDAEQAEWAALTNLCLSFADRYTFGSSYQPGEAAESLRYLGARLLPEDREDMESG